MAKVYMQEALFESGPYNYAYLVVTQDGTTCAIDTPEGEKVERCMQDAGVSKLDKVLITHWHHDHTGGNKYLKDKYNCEIIGEVTQKDKIEGIDTVVEDKQEIKVGSATVQVLHTPGHTLGHTCYLFKEDGLLFTGDLLFAAGCGRVFEGSMQQMHDSLMRVKNCGNVTVYPAHEYTQKNLEFTLDKVDPSNDEVKKRLDEVKQLRGNKTPSLPVKMDMESKTNPFLRSDDGAIQQHLNMEGKDAVEVFTKIRKLKDEY